MHFPREETHLSHRSWEEVPARSPHPCFPAFLGRCVLGSPPAPARADDQPAPHSCGPRAASPPFFPIPVSEMTGLTQERRCINTSGGSESRHTDQSTPGVGGSDRREDETTEQSALTESPSRPRSAGQLRGSASRPQHSITRHFWRSGVTSEAHQLQSGG